MKKDHMLQFSSMLNQALDVVVFTGAGMSTESGIPDFRGPQGVWKTQQPIDFRDVIATEDVRRTSWKRKFSSRDRRDRAQANSDQHANAELVKQGKV